MTKTTIKILDSMIMLVFVISLCLLVFGSLLSAIHDLTAYGKDLSNMCIVLGGTFTVTSVILWETTLK